MKILCTFSGCFGDILWSLPTVRQISKNNKTEVYMGVMPAYHSLLPLLNSQSYIKHAFCINDWICQGSPCGDQPWCPQNNEMLKTQYDEIHHLTYRNHPAPNQPLVEFIANGAGVKLEHPICPFIDIPETWWHICENYEDEKLAKSEEVRLGNYATYGFNPMYKEMKDEFFTTMKNHCPDVTFIQTDKLSWKVAAIAIANSICFVGCRSSQHVLAHGVGQKNMFIYEPHPGRHHQGHYGTTFACMMACEICSPLVTSAQQEAQRAATFINVWMKEKLKEN